MIEIPYNDEMVNRIITIEKFMNSNFEEIFKKKANTSEEKRKI